MATASPQEARRLTRKQSPHPDACREGQHEVFMSDRRELCLHMLMMEQTVVSSLCFWRAALLQDLDRSCPSIPAIVREPLRLGKVTIQSRLPRAAGRLYQPGFPAGGAAVRRPGAGDDRSGQCAVADRKRRRALELAETCDEDRPLAIQLYGHVIPEMEEAARWVEAIGATVVDINMGCPVRKVVRTGGGSALMCQVDRAVELVAAMVRSVSIPVTVKMRLGWDDESLTAPALAREFEQVGAAAVIVHGRTRQQGFSGGVNRDGIRAVVEAVDRMPVVANGDIRSIADAASMFDETGCAAISIGRGALANPFFFRQLDHWSRTGEPGTDPSFDERLDLMSLPLPRPGRTPGRILRVPANPQDSQVVLSLHAHAQAPVPTPGQPVERCRLR